MRSFRKTYSHSNSITISTIIQIMQRCRITLHQNDNFYSIWKRNYLAGGAEDRTIYQLTIYNLIHNLIYNLQGIRLRFLLKNSTRDFQSPSCQFSDNYDFSISISRRKRNQFTCPYHISQEDSTYIWIDFYYFHFLQIQQNDLIVDVPNLLNRCG